MRRRPLDTPIVELNLLPFLDLVFAFIGILIVIFACFEMTSEELQLSILTTVIAAVVTINGQLAQPAI